MGESGARSDPDRALLGQTWENIGRLLPNLVKRGQIHHRHMGGTCATVAQHRIGARNGQTFKRSDLVGPHSAQIRQARQSWRSFGLGDRVPETSPGDIVLVGLPRGRPSRRTGRVLAHPREAPLATLRIVVNRTGRKRSSARAVVGRRHPMRGPQLMGAPQFMVSLQAAGSSQPMAAAQGFAWARSPRGRRSPGDCRNRRSRRPQDRCTQQPMGAPQAAGSPMALGPRRSPWDRRSPERP